MRQEMIMTSGVFSRVGWSREGNVSEAGVPPGVATHRDVFMRVATGAGMMESVPFSLRGSSVSLAGGRSPRATNGGCLLGILHWETGAEAAGEACCS